MDLFSWLSMLGGLAMFLFGMQLLGDGLKKTSGGRMEAVLETLTSNKLKAVLLGCGVTAVIQSSSATTVMVVGFVNSGIMKLSQAVGIIMGANIGTTATSWILSLTGIQSDNVFVKLLNPSAFSPIVAMIGVCMYMFAKSEKKKDVAIILLGFSVLMFGMQTMSAAVKPLAKVPEFTELLIKFKNPVLGMLAGTLLTAVIQSSSASVGILQALCVTGAVSFGTAIPIIMGQNIGTCVTALLSSVGASKNAKRAAFVHFYFNLLGTILFMVLFYGIHMIRPFGFMDSAANASGIAVTHTVFNLFATAVMLPLSSMLEKLACLTIRDKADAVVEESDLDEDRKLLDDRFLETTAVATMHSRQVTVNMAKLVRRSLVLASNVLQEFNEESVQEVEHMEAEIDAYEDMLSNYLMKLSTTTLSDHDSQSLTILLHCIGDFERISDHTLFICKSAQKMHDNKLSFSDKAREELRVYSDAIKAILNITIDAFWDENMSLAREIEPFEDYTDILNAELRKRHINRLRKGKCTVELGFELMDIITSFERIADHCGSIAVNVLQTKDVTYGVHSRKNELREKDETTYETLMRSYGYQYQLPN